MGMKKHSLTAPCEACAVLFHPRPNLVKIGRGRFCSSACSNTMKMGTPEERFWRNVIKSDGCWTYKSTGQRGYGKLHVEGKHLRAHRFSWELHFGKIPLGMLVCHKCDNPSCVRPDHLFMGTSADNTADMLAKGRYVAPIRTNNPRGELHHNSKITNADAQCIKALWAKGGMRQADIGAMFGISQTSVYYIVSGRNWAHIN
jgi:HNH endonuclease